MNFRTSLCALLIPLGFVACASSDVEPPLRPPVVVAAAPAGCAAHEGVANESTLFWSVLCEQEDGQVSPNGGALAAPKKGGKARVMATGSAFFSLAADDQALYVSRLDWTSMTLRLERLGLNEAEPQLLHMAGLFKEKAPHAIAIDATNVYFSDPSEGGGIYRIAKTGGAPVTVARVELGSILAVDRKTVYVATGCFDFWACGGEPFGSGRIIGIPEGGEPSVLVQGQSWIKELVIAGDAMYWTSADGLKTATTTGGGERVLSQAPGGSVCVVGDQVFFSTGDSIRQVSALGGAERDLARGVHVADLMADAASVYWVDAENGAAMRVDR